MRVKRINTIEEWAILFEAMKEKGWSLWRMQFSFDKPEGFHAWFWKDGKQDVEVVTYSEEVEQAIVAFNSQQKGI